MMACKLLELAALAGLSQSHIARHFGIPRQQVHLWSCGKRVVPKRYREALVTLVGSACQAGPAIAPVQRERLLMAWLDENLTAQGLNPRTSIHAVLKACAIYQAMPLAEMRKPTHAHRLQTLGAFVQEYGAMLQRIGVLWPASSLPRSATPPQDVAASPD